MRILMINYEFPPIGGGTGNACHYMLKEFASYPDLHIDLVTYSPDNTTHTTTFAPRINIHYVACGQKQSLHHWKTSELLRWLIHTRSYLAHHLGHTQYDLIHCWSGWPAGMLGYHFRRHAPYIIALRGSDIPGYNPRTALLDTLVLRRLSRRIWSHAARVTIVSADAARLASHTLPIDFTVIHNGVDTTVFYPQPRTITPPIRLLYVGRLIPRKGVQDLLSALHLLKQEMEINLSSQLTLTIVGSGIMETQLKEQTQQLSLTDTVNFAGPVPHDQLPAIYRSHDIFVLPSHTEAFSNAMQEAIASGLAILSTNTGGAELIDGNGLIFCTCNSLNLKEKLYKLLTDPDTLISLKTRSAELSKQMSWDAPSRSYLELYKSVLSM